MRKVLKVLWKITSRTAVIIAFCTTSFLVGWNKGHETGYLHALADTVLGLVNPTEVMLDRWRNR